MCLSITQLGEKMRLFAFLVSALKNETVLHTIKNKLSNNGKIINEV